MSVEIVALYGVSLCLLMPLVYSMLVAVVNLVNIFHNFWAIIHITNLMTIFQV